MEIFIKYYNTEISSVNTSGCYDDCAEFGDCSPLCVGED